MDFEIEIKVKEIKAVFVLGENHFRKCFSVFTGVWLRTENAFSGNAFQLACQRV